MNSSQSGKSVLEMLIVVAVAIILVTFAVAQFGNSSDNLERQNIAREFKVSLERARFDSVKRRPTDCNDMSRVVITSPTSFQILTDMNQNGTLEPASETRTIDFANRSNVQIVGDGLTYPITIRFDQRGNVTSGTCAALADVHEETVFCNMPCTAASANGQNATVVFISRTGTAAMFPGGMTMPTFDEPAVANIDATSQINPLLSVWQPEASTPLPSPTATPFPTSTPTGTPEPTPTGTPEPTPQAPACEYGQRPSQTGCECLSPMWIRKNGRCQ